MYISRDNSPLVLKFSILLLILLTLFIDPLTEFRHNLINTNYAMITMITIFTNELIIIGTFLIQTDKSFIKIMCVTIS